MACRCISGCLVNICGSEQQRSRMSKAWGGERASTAATSLDKAGAVEVPDVHFVLVANCGRFERQWHGAHIDIIAVSSSLCLVFRRNPVLVKLMCVST
jgi:hypothetical protein